MNRMTYVRLLLSTMMLVGAFTLPAPAFVGGGGVPGTCGGACVKNSDCPSSCPHCAPCDCVQAPCPCPPMACI